MRVEEFALYLIWHDDWRRQHAAAAADEAPELLIGSGWATAVRGLRASSATAVERIRAWQQQIRGRIDDEIFPMIQRWTIDCTKHGDLEAACILRAHMAYCYKNVRAADLDFRAVSTLLSSQIFITSRYTFELDSRAGEALKRSAELDKHVNRSLGIPQTELFQLWQKHRGKLVAWLRKSPQLCNEVMESIIRVATLTGTRAKPRGAAVARAWQSMSRPGCFGRFIPDTEVETARRAFEEANLMSRTFREWLLRTTTQSVDTEINVQFGEFTLKKHLVTSLAPSIASQPDFLDVFGRLNSGVTGISSAEVLNTKNRAWNRLVGRRHDLLCWFPDAREKVTALPYFPTNGVGGVGISKGQAQGRPFPRGICLTGEEDWLWTVLSPHVQSGGALVGLKVRCSFLLFAHLFFCLLIYSFVCSSIFCLPVSSFVGLKLFMQKEHLSRTAQMCVMSAIIVDVNPVSGAVTMYPKVIHVYRQWRCVNLFELVEHGRHFYYAQSWCSDTRYSYFNSGKKMPKRAGFGYDAVEKIPLVTAGNAQLRYGPAPSLIVKRTLTRALGTQTFIPNRLLRGIVPSSLVKKYRVWQSDKSGVLHGYERKREDAKPATMLVIDIVPEGPPSTSLLKRAPATAIVSRIELQVRVLSCVCSRGVVRLS